MAAANEATLTVTPPGGPRRVGRTQERKNEEQHCEDNHGGKQRIYGAERQSESMQGGRDSLAASSSSNRAPPASVSDKESIAVLMSFIRQRITRGTLPLPL